MRREWQGLLRVHSAEGALTFEGSTSGDEWDEGELCTHLGIRVANVTRGIVDFIGTPAWSERSIGKIVEEEWVRLNWERRSRSLTDSSVGILLQAAIASGPLRVEIAAGPGGGLMPGLLTIDPSASMLVSDLEYTIVAEWRRFLRERMLGMNLSFACFDARSIPLKDASTDCFCSVAGLTSIPNHRLAVEETFRVLRPGGLLIMQELQVMKNSIRRLQGEQWDQIWHALPGVSGSWAGLLKSVGYFVCRNETVERRFLRPHEWGLAAAAAKDGVRMGVETHNLVARKP